MIEGTVTQYGFLGVSEAVGQLESTECHRVYIAVYAIMYQERCLNP